MALAIYLYVCGVALTALLTEEDGRIHPLDLGMAIGWPIAAPILIAAALWEKITGRGVL